MTEMFRAVVRARMAVRTPDGRTVYTLHPAQPAPQFEDFASWRDIATLLRLHGQIAQNLFESRDCLGFRLTIHGVPCDSLLGVTEYQRSSETHRLLQSTLWTAEGMLTTGNQSTAVREYVSGQVANAHLP